MSRVRKVNRCPVSLGRWVRDAQTLDVRNRWETQGANILKCRKEARSLGGRDTSCSEGATSACNIKTRREKIFEKDK